MTMTMQSILLDLAIPQIDLARAAQLSPAACNRLVKHGEWPKLRTADAQKRVVDFLRGKGANLQLDQFGKLVTAKEKPPVECESTGGGPKALTEELKEEVMLLRNEALTHETKKHFKLLRSPFIDDVQTRSDVFVSPGIRYVRAALMDAATNHGFCAVVGESGSGKSTLLEDLEERVRDEGKDVVIIKPYVLAMEENDQRGKTLKSGQIAEAIARCLAPSVSLKSSPESRFRQIHDLLKQSRKAGHTHLLAIEEAHCMPITTLKHLKRFLELKDGLQRLIGIALIGQPELRARLSEQNPEVREVVQRCELVEMEPLDNDLEAYLKHKFERMDLRLDDVFAADAFDAIRARLIRLPRGGKASDAVSACYPLVVNNLVCRAMNAAARAGWPKVDAQVIAGC